jgi:hypothetical protein
MPRRSNLAAFYARDNRERSTETTLATYKYVDRSFKGKMNVLVLKSRTNPKYFLCSKANVIDDDEGRRKHKFSVVFFNQRVHLIFPQKS